MYVCTCVYICVCVCVCVCVRVEAFPKDNNSINSCITIMPVIRAIYNTHFFFKGGVLPTGGAHLSMLFLSNQAQHAAHACCTHPQLMPHLHRAHMQPSGVCCHPMSFVCGYVCTCSPSYNTSTRSPCSHTRAHSNTHTYSSHACIMRVHHALCSPAHRERKDRLTKAKRLANTISKSNLGIEARQVGLYSIV
jgi:hypothetical protein